MNRSKIVKTTVAALAAAAFLCAGFQPANAAVLANYTFNANNGNSSDTDPNSVAGTFAGTGLTVSYSDPGWVGGDTVGIRAHTQSMATADGTDYWSFTITPTAGNRLMLSGTAALTFEYGRSSTITTWTYSWAVRSSLDGYTGTLASGSVTTPTQTWLPASVDLSSAFNNQDSAVTFRIYVWDGGDSSTFRYGYIDNVVLNGTVVPVPEPMNVALGVFGLCAVGFAAGRRYLRKRS